MNEATLGIELTTAAVVIFVLLFAYLINLLPLKKLHIPFTVAIMVFGMGLGIAVNYLSDSQTVEKETLSTEVIGPISHGEGSSSESIPNHTTDHQHSLMESVKNDFLYIFSALGNNLSPELIFFIFLPILVFESAYNMEAREVLKNILPITILAVPGLILSTVICGAALIWGGGAKFGLTWPSALLFGALISATDPVAVVAIFKNLGAPKRLGVLVEGESLFNDGTAIVLFNILLVFVLGTNAEVSILESVGMGTLDFAIVVLGGIFIGLSMAFVAWFLIGKIVDNSDIEISLTLVLAYLSFIVAEHLFHVSGVMAIVVAGLVSASYGKTKLSPSVAGFMHKLWEYLAFVMNALIFFIVGLVIAMNIKLAFAISILPLLGVTIIALMAARALAVYGSLPLTKFFIDKVELPFQTVIFWGGLRGAIGLALALTVATTDGIPEIVQQTILTLAAGVVLFTLLVNALTIEPIIKWLGIARPTLVDQFALAHAELVVCDDIEQVISRQEAEEVAPRVIESLRTKNKEREEKAVSILEKLRKEAADDPGQLEAVASLLALAVEKSEVLARYSSGSLTEHSTNILLGSASKLQDRVKKQKNLPQNRPLFSESEYVLLRFLSFLSKIPGLHWIKSYVSSRKLKHEININRGMFLTARGVDKNISGMEDARTIDLGTLSRVQAHYFVWELKAQQNVEELAAKHPELVGQLEGLMAEFEVLSMEEKSIEQLKAIGLMTEKAWNTAHENVISRKKELRKKLGDRI